MFSRSIVPSLLLLYKVDRVLDCSPRMLARESKDIWLQLLEQVPLFVSASENKKKVVSLRLNTKCSSMINLSLLRYVVKPHIRLYGRELGGGNRALSNSWYDNPQLPILIVELRSSPVNYAETSLLLCSCSAALRWLRHVSVIVPLLVGEDLRILRENP